MRTFFFLAAVTAAIAAAGCRGRGATTKDVAGVGFELPGAAHVARGAIFTTPPGREEAFLAFVAGQATAWVDACVSEAGGQTPVFRLATGDTGALQTLMPEAGETAREHCLAARARASTAPALPGRTHVKVQLVLK